MKIIGLHSLVVPDVKVIRFARFHDYRGYFTEPFRRSDLRNYPGERCFARSDFVQVNESYSHAGVIRGLHFQWNPFMGKLVRTLAGHMVDLILDIRKGSPFFGKLIAYDMPASRDAEYGEWIWVPPGFAHGNYFTEASHIEYLCSGEYNPGCEAGISPLAADLDWSLCEPALKARFDAMAAAAILASKDRDGLTLMTWDGDARSENFVYGTC
jgi:dTDP-4-dehydrorhamnose 3,5-epimerase